MKTLLLTHKDDFTPKDFIRRTAVEDDYSTLIRDSCKMVDKDTGNLIGVYFILPKTPVKLIHALMTIKYDKNKRLAGLITNSRIFGYKPREQVRNNFCSSAQLSMESPIQHRIICDFAKDLSKIYKKYCGDVYDTHAAITKEKVLKQWTIDKTPFSSGIVNKNNALHYHFDSGNFKSVYSNMVAFRSNIKGGHLSIPEYDVGLEISNNSILLFDGQKIMHGVTPFKKMSPKAYRYTIVYYTLQQMWKCEPINAELARIKEQRTTLEKKRHDRLTGKIPNTI